VDRSQRQGLELATFRTLATSSRCFGFGLAVGTEAVEVDGSVSQRRLEWSTYVVSMFYEDLKLTTTFPNPAHDTVVDHHHITIMTRPHLRIDFTASHLHITPHTYIFRLIPSQLTMYHSVLLYHRQFNETDDSLDANSSFVSRDRPPPHPSLEQYLSPDRRTPPPLY